MRSLLDPTARESQRVHQILCVVILGVIEYFMCLNQRWQEPPGRGSSSVPCVAAKRRDLEKWDLGERLQSCFSMGKPISFLLPTARPLTICCCSKRLWHGKKPRGEARHSRGNSIQSHFILHPRAALCHGGSSCAGRRSEEALVGSGEEGRQTVCCREREGGISRNFEEFGNR